MNIKSIECDFLSCVFMPKFIQRTRPARTGSAILDFLPSLIHEAVRIYRKVSAPYGFSEIHNKSIFIKQFAYSVVICEWLYYVNNERML